MSVCYCDWMPPAVQPFALHAFTPRLPHVLPLYMAAAVPRSSVSPRAPEIKIGWGTHDSNLRWLNIEPCGVICASITWAIVLFCTYAFLGDVISPWLSGTTWGLVQTVVFSTNAFLGLASHLRTMLSNPGAVPPLAKPLDPVPAVIKNCPYCRSFKPERAHHCSICRRCVIKMDHHCPWVNNCVGLANQKYFVLFLLYIFLISAQAVLTIVWRYWGCMTEDFEKDQCPGKFGRIGFIIPLMVFAILFGMFTFCMMMDQMHAIVTNVSAIDRLKSGHADTNARQIPREVLLYNLSEVFGGEPTRGFRLHWLFPTPISYPDPERLTGYSLREPRGSLFAAAPIDRDLEAM